MKRLHRRLVPTASLLGLLFIEMAAAGVGQARADSVTTVKNIQASGYGRLYIGNRAPLQPSPLLRLPPGSIIPQGWLLTLLQTQSNGLDGLQTEISPFLQYATSDWTTPNGSGTTQGWERVPYWLRGYIDLGYCLDSPVIISNASLWIRGVMRSARTNGYFGPAQDYADANTTSDLGINVPDLWPNMPMLDALRSYYDYTGDTNALALMRNYCSWEASLPPADFGAGYWPMMRMGDNIESVVWLYNRLGEPWLLTLSSNMYANMARWDTSNSLPNWHNVNIAEGFRAPTVYWQQTDNPAQFAFAESNYQVVMSQYGQVPGGGFGGDEVCRTGYYGPRQGFETCGIVEFMRSFEILTRVTGDPVWAERCEDLAANSLPAALRTNMMALHYLTAPNQPELDNEAKWPDINNGGNPWFSQSPSEPNYYCCEHNHGMGWPYFCEETWLATWDDGLCASLYAPTTVRAAVGGGTEIVIAESTSYPFGDTVQLTVSMSASGGVSFPLYCRVPQWCSNGWIEVNGQGVLSNCPPSSYACLQRNWANGDQVTLHFPRQVALRIWTANNNSVSVNYGPLTFSMEIPENWQSYGNNPAPWTEFEAYPAAPWNYGLVLNATNPAASFTVVTNPSGVMTNPFSLDAAPIQLQVQARKIPAWTLDNLYAVGPVQPSPAYSTQAVETITLVPMGAARLRISAFPTVSTNSTATQWSAPYAPSASYTNSTDTVYAMNDALLPASSSDTTIPRMTWWNHLGTTEWAQAAFNGLCQASQVSVYWYDDTGSGQCRVPQSWWVEYLAGTNWMAVSNATGYGVARNQFDTVQFTPVQTTSLRLYVQLQSGYSGGVLEWQVPATPITTLATHYPLDGSLADVASGQNGVLAGGTYVADRSGAAGHALAFNGSNTNYASIPRPAWMDWTMAYWVKTASAGSYFASAYSASGKFGGALYLDGSHTLGTASGAFPSGVPTNGAPYTIAVWECAASNCPANGGFIGWGVNSTGEANDLRLNGPNSVDDYWWADDFVVTGLSANPMDGKWHALAVTWDGATETFYVDGTSAGTRTPSGAPNVQNANFVVGKTTGDVNFAGWMENLLVVNRALTPAEIAGYQTGFSNSAAPSGTVGYWKFNNAANLGADSSGLGNTLAASAGSSGNGSQWYDGQGIVDGFVASGADDFGTSVLGGQAAFGVGNPDTTITSTTAINDGQWHHVAATRNAYTGVMQLYVDGALQASTNGPFGPKTSPPGLTLGGIQTGVSGGFLNGTIDDVQLFGSVLSAAEIKSVMNQSLSLGTIANTNLIAGQTLVASNSAADPYSPPATLAWSLTSAPAGAAIDPASGVVTWRPTMAQAPSTNVFSVFVTDNGSPSLQAAASFVVGVSPPAVPQISAASLSDGWLQFEISGDQGPDYIIQTSTNLGFSNDWQSVASNASPAMPFVFTNAVSSNSSQQFYRIQLGP